MADAAKVQLEVRALKGVVDKLNQKVDRQILNELCKKVDKMDKSLGIVGQRSADALNTAENNWKFINDLINAVSTLRTQVKDLQTGQSRHLNEIAYLKKRLAEQKAEADRLRADHAGLYKQVEGLQDHYLAFRKKTEEELKDLKREMQSLRKS